MKLSELEKVIRGTHSVILVWQDKKRFKYIESFCEINTIRYVNKKLLDAKVLKVDIDYQVIRIHLQVED